MKGDRKTHGVSSEAATPGTGKGVKGFDPYARVRTVDEKAAPFGGPSAPKGKMGGRAKRSRNVGGAGPSKHGY